MTRGRLMIWFLLVIFTVIMVSGAYPDGGIRSHCACLLPF